MRKLVIISLLVLFAGGSATFAVPQIQLHYALQTQPVWDNPKHPSIVMLGDSQTFIPNWPRLMGCSSIANFGIGGQTSAQILGRLNSAMAQNPKLVVIMAGTNDALQNVSPMITIANIKQMKLSLRGRRIAYAILTPPPLPANQEDIIDISSVATVRIPFSESDLLADKTHLRRSGYAKWRNAIAPLVHKYC